MRKDTSSCVLMCAHGDVMMAWERSPPSVVRPQQQDGPSNKKSMCSLAEPFWGGMLCFPSLQLDFLLVSQTEHPWQTEWGDSWLHTFHLHDLTDCSVSLFMFWKDTSHSYLHIMGVLDIIAFPEADRWLWEAPGKGCYTNSNLVSNNIMSHRTGID